MRGDSYEPCNDCRRSRTGDKTDSEHRVRLNAEREHVRSVHTGVQTIYVQMLEVRMQAASMFTFPEPNHGNIGGNDCFVH